VPLHRILRSAGAGAERILDRVLCVAGAVASSQFPEFMQQYLQRLEGHLDEARIVLGRLRDAAAQSGMSLEQLEASAAHNPDPSIVRLSGVITVAAQRVDQLASADAALRAASAWTRPFVFAAHADWGIVRATASIYRPAVPTTAEGLVYAAAGMVAALAAYHLCLRAPLARRLRRRAAERADPARQIPAD
jgi:hypothetical protein